MTELFLVIAIVAAFFLGMFPIEALRYQVMRQNKEINRYRAWIRKTANDSPHQWYKDEAWEILDESD